jgi:hypothetical protein
MTTVYVGDTPYNFPDDMTPDQIQAAMQQHAQPQMPPGVGREAALDASAALKGGTEGVAGAVSTMAAPILNPAKAVLGYAAPWLVGDDPQKQQQLKQQFDALSDPSHFPSMGERAAGLTDRPDLIPQNARERYTTAGIEAGASMLPSLMAPESWGGRAKTLIQGIIGGLGGQGASDLAQSANASDIVKKYAPVVGNLAASVGAGGLLTAGNKLAGMATGEQSPTTQAYSNLDITPRMAGDVSGNPFLQQLQTTVAKLPGGFGPTERAAATSVDEWGGALNRTAHALDPMGIARTEETVGQHLQTRANNWLDTFSTRNQINANNLDMQIPGVTPTPTTNYRDALNQIRTDIPTAEATRGVLEPDLNRRLLDSLTTDTRIPARNTGLVDASGRAIMTPETTRDLTWADVQGIRKRIGERLSEPAAYDTPDIGKLKQLYAALSNDQEALANSQGQAAQDAFNTMRDYARNGHDFIDAVLSKIVKGDSIAPAQATRNVMSTAPAGGTMLNRLRAELPDAVDALGAWKLRDAALANKGQQSGAGNRQSPGTFVTDMNGLSHEAQTALYGHNPAVASDVYDLRQVAGNMKDTARFANTSGTTPMAEAGKLLTGGAVVEGMRRGYQLGGIPGAVAGAVVPFVPGAVGSRLLTNPAITRFAASPGAVGTVPSWAPAAWGVPAQYPPGLLQ